MADQQEDALQRLLQSGAPAMLEIGSALKSAQAWEVEAGLILPRGHSRLDALVRVCAIAALAIAGIASVRPI